MPSVTCNWKLKRVVRASRCMAEFLESIPNAALHTALRALTNAREADRGGQDARHCSSEEAGSWECDGAAELHNRVQSTLLAAAEVWQNEAEVGFAALIHGRCADLSRQMCQVPMSPAKV